MSQLHKLGLHETINNVDNDSHFMIMRVPGGWIYRFFKLQQEYGSNVGWSENHVAERPCLSPDSVFVPFNSEFNTESPK